MNDFFNYLVQVAGFFSAVVFLGCQYSLCIMAPEQWFTGFVGFLGLIATSWWLAFKR